MKIYFFQTFVVDPEQFPEQMYMLVLRERTSVFYYRQSRTKNFGLKREHKAPKHSHDFINLCELFRPLANRQLLNLWWICNESSSTEKTIIHKAPQNPEKLIKNPLKYLPPFKKKSRYNLIADFSLRKISASTKVPPSKQIKHLIKPSISWNNKKPQKLENKKKTKKKWNEK